MLVPWVSINDDAVKKQLQFDLQRPAKKPGAVIFHDGSQQV